MHAVYSVIKRDGKLPNPLLKVATRAARDVIQFGNKFGLSPSWRVRGAAGRVFPEHEL